MCDSNIIAQYTIQKLDLLSSFGNTLLRINQYLRVHAFK